MTARELGTYADPVVVWPDPSPLSSWWTSIMRSDHRPPRPGVALRPSGGGDRVTEPATFSDAPGGRQ